METNTPTFRERLNARLEGRKIEKSEKGLALLDVLIGMAIFALIAIIAVSAISQYRARAYESGAVNDARAIGIALEAQYTDANSYPDATDMNVNAAAANQANSAFYGDNGVKLTKDNAVSDFTVSGGAGAAQTFSFCVTHKDGPWAKYDSAAGGIVDKSRTGTCS